MNWFSKLREGLSKSAQRITTPLKQILTHKRLTAENLDDVETILLQADFGVAATNDIIESLRQVKVESKSGSKIYLDAVHDRIVTLMEPYAASLPIPKEGEGLKTYVFVGVNGGGKTTTVAKVAAYFKGQGLKVACIAGDTFRAAANQQLALWAKKIGVACFEGAVGSDPAALVFSSLEHAQREGYDVLLIDTAGRLHNQKNLMDALGKMMRVLKKWDVGAPSETFLILDGTVGQNALSQVALFRDAVPVTGLIVTKLDGTSRCGILVQLTGTFEIPIVSVGVGEGVSDMGPLNPTLFADRILGSQQE
jgi:fused signal recognition particle receptor